LPCRSPAATRTPAANEITAHVHVPKASLTGRVVRANNTMRVAKSWGHSGGPVPAEWATILRIAPTMGGEKAVPENIPRMLMRVRPTPPAHRRAVRCTCAPFEVADYLDSEEAISEYLSLAARDENPGVLLKALGDVAKARGIAEVAKASGLGRESLYKTLAPGAKPRFETIATIMRALNVGFSVESRLPVRAKKARRLTVT
jgi:probable addiction module antidote protein